VFAALLAARNIAIDAVNADDDTALMFAARKEHEQIVSMLIKKGANVNIF
jgi:ankyrin repeat protein